MGLNLDQCICPIEFMYLFSNGKEKLLEDIKHLKILLRCLYYAWMRIPQKITLIPFTTLFHTIRSHGLLKGHQTSSWSATNLTQIRIFLFTCAIRIAFCQISWYLLGQRVPLGFDPLASVKVCGINSRRSLFFRSSKELQCWVFNINFNFIAPRGPENRALTDRQAGNKAIL